MSRKSRTSSKRRKTGKRSREYVEIDQDLKEEFARLEQEEAGEEEWEEFCQRERT